MAISSRPGKTGMFVAVLAILDGHRPSHLDLANPTVASFKEGRDPELETIFACSDLHSSAKE